MGSANKENQPTQYIIHIKNHLDSHCEHWFEGMTITYADDGVTILSGDVVDQSALYGLLEKIHNLNLSLISFQKVDPEGHK
jgi:hypothetical protein